MENEDFIMRHATKPKEGDLELSKFKGISEKGVELLKPSAIEIFESLEKSESGTILFLGGTSERVRTKSTSLICGDEIKKIVLEQNKKDILVFMPEDLKKINGYLNKIKYLVNQINANPEKKIVINFPLFIKEFLYEGDFATKDDKETPYMKEMSKLSEGYGRRLLKIWFENKGILGDLKGPNPKEVAEKQLEGVNRLRKFVKKYIPDRPLIIGSVGHNWSLGALATYLVNNGEITPEAFEKKINKMVEETDIVKLTQKNGKSILQYGELLIPLEE